LFPAAIFGWRLWQGGEAHLLVSHPASETRPLYSPDGTRLAFVSTRTGNGDIYVLTLATGAIKRITFDDVPDVLNAWSRDGKWLFVERAGYRGNAGYLSGERGWRCADAGHQRPLRH
jgi:Tol biopolymer transport system component